MLRKMFSDHNHHNSLNVNNYFISPGGNNQIQPSRQTSFSKALPCPNRPVEAQTTPSNPFRFSLSKTVNVPLERAKLLCGNMVLLRNVFQVLQGVFGEEIDRDLALNQKAKFSP